MKVSVHPTAIPDVLIVDHEVFEDGRGFFLEVFREDLFAEYAALGLPNRFVQLNHSGSVRGVTRGLHFQWDPPMGKLMRVTRGEAFLVAVDIRPGSPTLGQHVSLVANERNRLQLWAPATFARGFAALGEVTEVQYLTTGTYNRDGEGGILWNDPALGIDWPLSDPIVSAKDAAAPTLADWLTRPEAAHFRMPGPEPTSGTG
ncbi:MAG: dTDP-4-dehydrorhamnose 3,5-epimerase [Chloroflexota bacterium]